MSDVWFTSDTHFSHRLVARLRGYDDVEAYNDLLVRNWNEVVGKDDVVWHLGDVGLGRDSVVLDQVRRLNGRVQLVTGNHDPCWPAHRRARVAQRAWMQVFESVQAFAKIKLGQREVLMSHFPYQGDHTAEDRYSQFRLRDEGLWLLHGHVHSPEKSNGYPHQLHVGLDAWDLHPVDLGTVTRWIRDHEE
jgi:calcineurin-like phosphoesterase family protein